MKHPFKDTVLVYLDENMVNECKERAVSFCKYKKWGDSASEQSKQWKKGILNDENDPSQAERIGQYGELAFSILTGIDVDKEVNDNGNKYDFPLLNNQKVEIKTSKILYKEATKSKGYYGPFFIKATNEYGKRLPLRSDYYVFTSIFNHNGTVVSKGRLSDIDATMVMIEIHGFISKEQILDNTIQRENSALNGKHTNYYIKEEEIISPISFISANSNLFPLNKSGVFI